MVCFLLRMRLPHHVPYSDGSSHLFLVVYVTVVCRSVTLCVKCEFMSSTLASLYECRRSKDYVNLNYYGHLVLLISPWIFNNNYHKLPTILLT